MLPKIKKMELRNVHIDDEIYKENDLFLFQHGVEAVDASDAHSLKDLEKMLLHEPEAVIFGLGFKQKSQLDKKILDLAKKNKVELHALPTSDAVKKFQEMSRSGKKVVAKLHIVR